ncbi:TRANSCRIPTION FACTOR TGA2.3-LIKE ISOFORM X1 [Salix koriyanagi]|uniref:TRANSCRIPTION FACTOR TGA2.3-LIKE ISOFORM X1 n=1 Tax=Salix koriyanagi TaxID=2511006 RepID=A0A9Q0SZH3_9ROSI|nr:TRANSCRIPTION FACTOR TGA2.3-LIKE ISOFORM X1 [Salix koriyanagi]
MGSGTGAEDEKKAVGMPSFDPQLPISNAISVEGSTVHPYCVTDFGVFLEDNAIDLSAGTVFNSAKESSRAIPSDCLHSGTFEKKQSTTSFNIKSSASQEESHRLPLEKVQQPNQVSIPIVDTENWGETWRLPLEKVQQSNRVSIPSVNTENWGEADMADASPRTDISTDADTDDKNQRYDRGQSTALMASDSSDRTKDKLDQKTLRRLAQNREAARKSRLRKKAYVQQLESSRLKLSQLEQELQRARQQGIFISSSGDQAHSMSGNGAMAFDVEYARWLEEQNRQINELRSAVNSHAGDAELRIIIDERCFLWLGGFRSSELLKDAVLDSLMFILLEKYNVKAFMELHLFYGFIDLSLSREGGDFCMYLLLFHFHVPAKAGTTVLSLYHLFALLLMNHLEPLTEQQLVGIGNLQQSSQQAEDALSQGMEALQQSLSETLCSGSLGSSGSSGNVANYMGQMAMAMGKLGTLEGFIRQADNLRQQTLQQMHRILTTRQSARALLAIHDYFSRLRALSSLWLARPKE